MIGSMRAGNKSMEDAMAYNEMTAVIADGHGGFHGAQLAEKSCEDIMKAMHGMDDSYDPEKFFETMPALYHQIHMEYKQCMLLGGGTLENGIPVVHGLHVRGGCTLATMVHSTFQGRAYIMTANVGDTEVFLFTVKDGVYRAKQLTTTHCPTSQSEYFRIQKLGMRAGHCMYDTKKATTVGGHLPIFNDDGTYVVYEDTYTPYKKAYAEYHRIYTAVSDAKKAGLPYHDLLPLLQKMQAEYKIKTTEYMNSPDGRRCPSTVRDDRGAYLMQDTYNSVNMIRLAMTRAIGDYPAHEIGLTTEPAVHLTWLDQEDLGDHAMVFMASDGILDCYEFDNLAKIVFTSDQTTLLDQFREKAMELFQECDDMSYVMKQLL
jgi:serine/threonine protein phosphatase PrpC